VRVLLVDQDPGTARVLAADLGPEASVTRLESVAAALALVDRERFDMVVTELRLPGRWGDELLAYVSARSPSTRRFLLTADLEPERTVHDLLDLGVIHGCFAKSRSDALVRAVRAFSREARPVPPA
jgi:response regulator RpfG family c-di-GMP phosphodiesterase